jgi:alanine racemase
MLLQSVITDGVLRPTQVEVDLGVLGRNYAAIQERIGAQRRIMVVLKANGYGHGMVAVARHMQRLGAPYFGVAYLEEGILLRSEGIDTPILVMGGMLGNQAPLFLQHDLTVTASSVEKLQQIEAAAREMGVRARVHLKIDTGMERIGVHYYSARPLLEAAQGCEHCDIEGIYSHFANADSADLTHARLQVARFEEVLAFYDRQGLPRPLCHMANSGGILQLPESWYDMVRPGILFYGVLPSAETACPIAVTPALTWKSRVVYFKVVQPGHPVSYGSTWQAERMTRVVTVPTGYGDGYFRAMSNRAEVIIRGKRYPVVGRICMDQMMVDIGWETAYNGDEVLLVGSADNGTTLTVEMLADWAGTIPYEILTNINTRVPRVYVGGDRDREGR